MPIKVDLIATTVSCEGFFEPRCCEELTVYLGAKETRQCKILAAGWYYSATQRSNFWLCSRCQDRVRERFRALRAEYDATSVPQGAISDSVSPTHIFEYQLQHYLAALDRNVALSFAPLGCSSTPR